MAAQGHLNIPYTGASASGTRPSHRYLLPPWLGLIFTMFVVLSLALLDIFEFFRLRDGISLCQTTAQLLRSLFIDDNNNNNNNNNNDKSGYNKSIAQILL